MQTIDQELLDEVVDRLAVEFDPEQIILFGSHAWGTPSEDSDIDLLVVVPRSEERPRRTVRPGPTVACAGRPSM